MDRLPSLRPLAAVTLCVLTLACQSPAHAESAAVAALPAATSSVDGLYVHAFGDLTGPTLVFIHGGPGWNSFDFEVSTAAALAAEGFGVVVYDQRGSGRSLPGTAADYTLEREAEDLRAVVAHFDLKKPVLLGHSFGGTVGLRFLADYPGIAAGLIFVDSPMNWPASIAHMLKESAARYRKRGNAAGLKTVLDLQSAMFPAGGQPHFDSGNIGETFAQGVAAGLYFAQHPAADAAKIYARTAAADTEGWMTPEHASDQTEDGSPFLGLMRGVVTPLGTGYPYLDLTALVAAHGQEIYAVYGDEDGLFSAEDRAAVAGVLPAGHLQTISGAGHNVFMDQQAAFLAAVREAASRLSN